VTRRRIALAVAATIAWIAGATFGTLPSASHAQAAPLFAIGKAHAGYTPPLGGDKPIFILALGSDSRQDNATAIARGLGDSIHLIGINPEKNRASILGFPRDSWVNIPCGGGTNKINNALADGGPECMVQAIEDLTHIRIDYWVLTSFFGVKDAVDEIGRLTLAVPFTMHDHYSKSDFTPGTYDLKGFDVLAFARDRHSFAEGDFARSENQGRVLLAALTQFRKEFSDDPSRLFDWIGVGERNIQTSLSLSQLVSFGFEATQFDPSKVENMVVPGSIGFEGPQSVVHLANESRLYADMAKDAIVAKRNIPPSPTAGEH
jgi:polyisoprenyl-teichoic acid--peptidoglycan teichoic acid transferase